LLLEAYSIITLEARSIIALKARSIVALEARSVISSYTGLRLPAASINRWMNDS
jgi:hypothetical protein